MAEAGRLPDRRLALAVLLTTLSGCAALGDQIVWTRQGSLWLGQETAAVLAVLAAFFGGLALGGLALGPRLAGSRHPARWYVGLELLIALWCVALALWQAPVSRWMLDLIGDRPGPLWHALVAFVGTFVLLLPATAAMGATLPAMERLLGLHDPVDGRAHPGLPALYAGNTLGGVLGVLAAAFWWVPAWGLGRSALLCAALNVVCAAGACWLARTGATVHGLKRAAAPVASAPGRASPGTFGHPAAVLAWTGLLGIGHEVLVVRVLTQVTENTVYTYALLLAVYLVCTAAGAALLQRVRPPEDDTAMQRRSMQLALALAWACLLSGLALWGAGWIRAQAGIAFGAGLGAALRAEALLALAAFGLPALAMGAQFAHLAMQARRRGLDLGRAFAANTGAAALAPLAVGVVLIPLLGSAWTWLLIVAGYLLLAQRSAAALPGQRPWRGIAVPAVAWALVAVWAPPLALVDVPEGGQLLSHREGPAAAVSVVEDAGGVRTLRIDNRQQEGSSATRLADGRQALLPLLLHPAPRTALFLGLGTGVTASTAANDPALQVDVVELLPEVIEAMPWFAAHDGSPGAARLRVQAADARRHVRVSRQSHDVIVADNFHPARSGSGALYTVEHFQSVDQRLAPGGLFCQWLPLHQLDLGSLRSIVRSFLTVWPEGVAVIATHSLSTPVLGLIGRRDGLRIDPAALHQRLADAAAGLQPARHGYVDELALLGSVVATPDALAAWSRDAEPNTDDHPVVAHLAPRITYAPDSRPADRLLALLGEWQVSPGRLLVDGADAGLTSRLLAYRQARDRYLQIGRDARALADVRRMLAQVGEPLRQVLALSPDFRPAYDPLLRMADALVAVDPAAGRALLADLVRLQPAWPEAGERLKALAAMPADPVDAR
ncbi:spermine/spermidine synthase domain-containing protein [Leptothrix discophora]|uniref:Spermidine synthase n=1 Tax=Leptothrix discophora TaxID=89 RepID=A0ABT9G1F2_LEPDI|nr:spermidine synthase [Leptothrix discophora]MDP4300003.1 spermidine synthase [Leptothrix discophora]